MFVWKYTRTIERHHLAPANLAFSISKGSLGKITLDMDQANRTFLVSKLVRESSDVSAGAQGNEQSLNLRKKAL